MSTVPLKDRALGRWRGILPHLGVEPSYLSGKHTACPICRSGKDRFRFDDREGRGTFFCTVCSAGDGVALAMRVNGWSFKEAAERIEALIGAVPAERPRPAPLVDQREAMWRLCNNSRPIERGDPAWLYLKSRGIDAVPSCLRSVDRMRYQDEDGASWWPGMIAVIRGADGRAVSLQRTYLTPSGEKAPLNAFRRLLAGSLPKSVSVCLSKPTAVLGLAEGVETALSASALFGVPCWASLDAGHMETWQPPDVVRHVEIFGDNDASHRGQIAAHTLASRLVAMGRTVRVRLPPTEGEDWNDVLRGRDGG